MNTDLPSLLSSIVHRLDAIESTLESTLSSIQSAPKLPYKSNTGGTLPIFLPELDYLLWITQLRNEFRVSVNGAYKEQTPDPTLPYSMLYGYLTITNPSSNAPSLHTYSIPTPLLKRDITFLYGTPYKLDFRYEGVKTSYIKGVYDIKTRGPYTGNAACAILKTPNIPCTSNPPLTHTDIIANTRTHWEQQTEEAKRIRIVDEAGMERLLDRMGAEGEAFFNSPRAWSLVTQRDMEARPEDTWYWLNPIKIELM